jgi:HEAT repeat protein
MPEFCETTSNLIHNEHTSMKNRCLFLVFCLLSALSVPGQTTRPDIHRAQQVLKEGLDAKDPDERVQAIQASGLIGLNERLRAQLQEALEDNNVEVRIAAINTLADLKSTQSIPAIRERLTEDKTPEVTFAAAKALYAMHNEAGKTALYDVYTGKEKATSDILHTDARKFMNNFHSLQSTGMFFVTTGLGYVPVPGVGEGFSAITGLLSDPNLSPRATALLLLARQKDSWTTNLLKNALGDDDWSVRASAAQLIAYGARTELSQGLVPLFADKDQKVRFRAAGAYLHLASVAPQESGAARAGK